MTHTRMPTPGWIADWMESHGIELWGAADLQEFFPPRDTQELRLNRALAWALPMPPRIMAAIQSGPNQAYADEYARVNERINTLSTALVTEIRHRGFHADALAASERTDTITIKGDFPHKTAATKAGLGWIGRHCQLITRPFGSWVRLGTVFCDLPLACGPAGQRSFCGRCMRCVEACPANALKGGTWYPGISRSALLDVNACDQWKKAHYHRFHKGHVCGICSAVCPYSTKKLKS